MKIEVSEVGLPSRTSHSRSLSGRGDCGGRDLWISGVGLEENKERGKSVTAIDNPTTYWAWAQGPKRSGAPMDFTCKVSLKEAQIYYIETHNNYKETQND